MTLKDLPIGRKFQLKDTKGLFLKTEYVYHYRGIVLQKMGEINAVVIKNSTTLENVIGDLIYIDPLTQIIKPKSSSRKRSNPKG